ncbi:RNA polymerase recycling motor HelD [Alkaliphilus serpentinus]|uniref:AAA family ATPase n=1 Tax=Alkaliphilus serpentinus TaxID=1482731 RepID=A0A833HP58_9FIRM|nr:RNA polymerase recycling motor HelD [Alkaliphilus serpentinus]KAB3530436.1 AAA family ATPase [Alkaliphilus serpentinus]
MEALKHPDYKAEDKKLKEVKKWVIHEKATVEKQEDSLKEEIKKIRKEVLHLQDERLIAKQQLHQFAERNLKNLKFAEESPYFGRVDFQEKNREEIEKIYIGKFGLHDQREDMPVVVDWRAPVADIYYSGHSKEVGFKAPAGEIKGEMHLKRRYEIVGGSLSAIYDEKTSENIIEDSLKGKGEFLIGALNKTTSGRLKEIVATIQDQQNKIIRSDSLRPLVVQGVAGSGKTTIALHRMAYLIYNNRKNLHTANYMVIAPNKLFLDYISAILPELGVDNVRQTTFEDWAMGILGRKVKLTKSQDKLNLLASKENIKKEVIATASKLKGSLLFRRVIDTHIRRLEAGLMPIEGLSYNGIPLLEHTTIREVFLTSNLHLSLEERIKKMKTYLKARLKKDKKDIKDQVDARYQKKILKAKAYKDQQEIIRLYDERDRIFDEIISSIPQLVDNYLQQVTKFSAIDFYKDLIKEKDELAKAFRDKMRDGLFDEVWQHIFHEIEGGILEAEDLTPLAYLHIKLIDFKERHKYNHIVVDEVQDFDEFRLSLLREIAINDSFTFVGDISQGIYGYRGINSWERTMERVFKDKNYHYHLLTTSYRSTIEIVELSNKVIKKCKGLDPLMAEPVFRHGEVPSLVKVGDQAEMAEKIAERIEELKDIGYATMAIICKNLEETKRAYGYLENLLEDVKLLTDDEDTFINGIVVIPSYLSKGLEFDGVFLWNVDEDHYTDDPMDVKLLYVGITRALHRLYLYYLGKPSRLLDI